MLIPDGILAAAINLMEGEPHTVIDTFPTEDPKVNLIYEIGDEDFIHDVELLQEVPHMIVYAREEAQNEWARQIRAKAKTERLRHLTTREMMEMYAQYDMR